MQDFTSTECANLNRGQAIVLTDTRISKGESQPRTYRVKKMADDKCWMIDNLRYAYSSWTEPGPGQFMTNDGTNAQNSSNIDVYRYKNPGNSNSGCSPGATANCYGYLYNWYTATGGAGLYNTPTNTNVAGNICPNNSSSTNTNPSSDKWQLPTGGGNDTSPYLLATDYAILNDAMRDDTGTNPPPTQGFAQYSSNQINYENWQPANTFQGIFSGSYYSSLNNQGSYGLYWSSTANSTPHTTHFLYFSSSHVSLGSSYNYKYNGYPVRCLIR